MQAFEYASPTTVDEAVGLLSGPEGQARPLAGGTDLLVQLRAERYALQRVVDVKAIPELNQLRFSLSDGLTLGAAVPCYRIYEDAALLAAYPGLMDSASILGGSGSRAGPAWAATSATLPRRRLDPLADRPPRHLRRRRARRASARSRWRSSASPRASAGWSRGSCWSPCTCPRRRPAPGLVLPALHPPQRDGHRRGGGASVDRPGEGGRRSRPPGSPSAPSRRAPLPGAGGRGRLVGKPLTEEPSPPRPRPGGARRSRTCAGRRSTAAPGGVLTRRALERALQRARGT